MTKHTLSPSALNNFIRCPRCFYLEKIHGLSYRGIFPSLPGGMDECLKKVFDLKRNDTQEVIFPVDKNLRLYEDQRQLDDWRNRYKGLRVDLGSCTYMGAIDDLLYVEKKKQRFFVPWDFKTKGAAPQDGYGERYYNFQISSYEYLMLKNGYKTLGYGYLTFVSPLSVSHTGADMMSMDILFQLTWQKIQTDIGNVQRQIEEAVRCLSSAKIPDVTPGCTMCDYLNRRVNIV